MNIEIIISVFIAMFIYNIIFKAIGKVIIDRILENSSLSKDSKKTFSEKLMERQKESLKND